MSEFYGVANKESGKLVKSYFTGRNTKICCFRSEHNADRARKNMANGGRFFEVVKLVSEEESSDE